MHCGPTPLSQFLLRIQLYRNRGNTTTPDEHQSCLSARKQGKTSGPQKRRFCDHAASGSGYFSIFLYSFSFSFMPDTLRLRCPYGLLPILVLAELEVQRVFPDALPPDDD